MTTLTGLFSNMKSMSLMDMDELVDNYNLSLKVI